MRKMLVILAIGSVLPVAAHAQQVPLGTPVDTSRMTARRAVPAEMRERAVEARARAERLQVRERRPVDQARMAEMLRRRSVQLRGLTERTMEQRRDLVERELDQRRAVEGQRQGMIEQRRVLRERALEGMRSRPVAPGRITPMRTPGLPMLDMPDLTENQRTRLRDLEQQHAERRRALDEELQRKRLEILTPEQRSRVEERRIQR